MKTNRILGSILILLAVLTLMMVPVIADPIPGGSGNPHFDLEIEISEAEITETGSAVHISITYPEYPGVEYNVVIVNGDFILNGIALWEGIHGPAGLNPIHASGNASLVGDTWILQGVWSN